MKNDGKWKLFIYLLLPFFLLVKILHSIFFFQIHKVDLKECAEAQNRVGTVRQSLTVGSANLAYINLFSLIYIGYQYNNRHTEHYYIMKNKFFQIYIEYI